MKTLICGAGGIGSFLIEQINDCFEKGYFKKAIDFVVADHDMVEAKQIMYQNYKMEDVGLNKAVAICNRFNLFKPWSVKIRELTSLKGFNLIILCVDNDKVRKLVVDYCFEHGKEFIDVRSTGRKVFAMPKLTDHRENLKFIDAKDMNEYSCQEKKDIELGNYQLGNKVAAIIGVQMLLNYSRGYNNRVHSIII